MALWRLPRPDFRRLVDTDFQDTPLTLQPADSPSRLMRPSTPEAPAALLPPPPLRLLPGGAIQFPGGFISRCGPVPFTAHCNRDVTPIVQYEVWVRRGRRPRYQCRSLG